MANKPNLDVVTRQQLLSMIYKLKEECLEYKNLYTQVASKLLINLQNQSANDHYQSSNKK